MTPVAVLHVPQDWALLPPKAFGDWAAFQQSAWQFEQHGLGSATRDAGFKAFAGHVLPERKKNGKMERWFPDVWLAGGMQAAVAARSFEKCSYCSCEISASQYPCVDHFQPKSAFPLLAYEPSNYFWCCERCNVNKSDNWPVCGYPQPGTGLEHLLIFEEDGTVSATDPRAVALIDDLKLKRDALVRARREQIAVVLGGVRRSWELLRNLPQAKELLMVLVEGSRQGPGGLFAVAVNQCLDRWWQSLY